MYKSLFDSKNLSNYKEKIESSFNDIFPRYFWEKSSFQIVYFYPVNDVKLEILLKDSELIVNCSSPIEIKFQEFANISDINKDYLQSEYVQELIRKFFFSNQHHAFFIPATRSFFSIIQKNVFKLDLSDTGDEFFIKRFGVIQQFVKERTRNFPENKKLDYENILKAQYYFDGSDEWLIKNGEKIRLRDSSTGQQELVYLVLFLATLDFSKTESNFFIIEEPDAHIFPSTQKQLIDLFATVFNNSHKSSGFLITSHSPYILTCFNNLLQSQNTFDAIKEKKKKHEVTENEYNSLLKKLNNIIPENRRICFEDISVLLIENGEIKDIKDVDNKLIDADPIDDVSEILSKEFHNLLDIKYGE